MAGIVLVALSLRGPIIAPTPVITNIQGDIGLSSVAATIGPPVAGGLNTLTGGWTAPLLLVLAATLVFGVGGVLAALSSGRARG